MISPLPPALVTCGWLDMSPSLGAEGVSMAPNNGRPTEPAASRMRVLVVEDDARVAQAVQRSFLHHQVYVEHAATLAAASTLLDAGESFDALVLDLNLPDGNGLDLAQSCRQRGMRMPIIMVTARDAIADRITGLQRGADDYLCKPFSVEELYARLDAVLRRVRPDAEHVLRYGDLELDLMRRQVRRGKLQATLSVRELDLLAYYLTHAGKVMKKRDILREVWGGEAEHDENVLQVYTNYLRNKTEQGIKPRIIHTIRGQGYLLATEPPDL
jgi:two-component system response regulator MprA